MPSTSPQRSSAQSATTLASRRVTVTRLLQVRKPGRLDLMSVTEALGASAAARPLGSTPRACFVAIPPPSVRQALEGLEGWLLPAGCGHEPRLPAGEARLVAHEEPQHHVDSRISTRDGIRLGKVARLRVPGDAEDPIGRPGLVAVLGDPQVLAAVQVAEQLEERADVAQSHRLRLGLRGRALVAEAVVRVMGVDVELLQPGLLEGAQKDQRIDS